MQTIDKKNLNEYLAKSFVYSPTAGGGRGAALGLEVTTVWQKECFILKRLFYLVYYVIIYEEPNKRFLAFHICIRGFFEQQHISQITGHRLLRLWANHQSLLRPKQIGFIFFLGFVSVDLLSRLYTPNS